ncbi:MAG: AraC family transcriptional regulator [Clostridia bacterium]|nr:AraC family transcriptional regulator [Clostridia bacterium]
MAYLEQIIEIISYIEANLKERMTLEDLSRRFHLSKFHLHRVFSSLTGMPLMKYIRERKLSCSVFDLMKTDMNIIDIAYEYGFSDEQSYIRAFRNAFNISPARARRRKEVIKITDKIDTGAITPVGDGLIFEPEMVIRPESFLVGVRSPVYDPATKQPLEPKTMGPDFFLNYRGSIRHTLNDDIYISYTELMPGLSDYDFYLENIHEPNKHWFLTVGADVGELSDIPPGMVGMKVPTLQFAVFKYIGFHSPNQLQSFKLEAISEFIYCRWLYQSAYQLSHEFILERIDLKRCRDDYTEYEIYVPVKEKHTVK